MALRTGAGAGRALTQNTDRPLRRSMLALLAAAFAGPAAALAEPPRLVVLIVAEQFRADYLELYGRDFVEGGFRRLQRDGAVYRRVRAEWTATLAAPGAATLATGAAPAEHGIVADAWFDRVLRQSVRAAEGTVGVFPERLVGSTLADELMLASEGRSRVVAVADNPAVAALLAGRRPRAIVWRGADGAFATGPYYAAAPPRWLRQLEADRPSGPAGRRRWVALDAPAGAPPLRDLDTADFAALYRASPFAMEETLELAAAALESEALGRREFPDLLVVGLDQTARLGLETGADSPLMRDLVLRLDRALSVFLSAVDAAVGLSETAVVFTGLHGIPHGEARRRPAGLRGGAVAGDELAQRVDEALRAEFGPDVRVWKYVYPNLYLSPEARRSPPERWERILRAAGQAALEMPGVAGWYAPGSGSVVGRLRAACEASFYPGRSGDLLFVYEPYWVEHFSGGRGVASGSPYRYDTDTPLILHGPGVRPGVRPGVVDFRDIAPTLAELLGISPPSASTGRPLAGALRLGGEPPPGPPGGQRRQ